MSWLSKILSAHDPEPPDPSGDPVRIAEVQAVLEALRPAVEADGGRIDLVAIEEGRVSVRLGGACASCYATAMTLQGALEPKLRELAWFERLEAV